MLSLADQPENVVAVTGSCGKTSVSLFIKQFFDLLGLPAASITTERVSTPLVDIRTTFTTPPAGVLPEYLHTIKQTTETLVLEVSREALETTVVDQIKFQVGVFINMHAENNDTTRSLEDFFTIKMRLFRELMQPESTAVVWDNRDTWSEIAIKQMIAYDLELITVGEKPENDVFLYEFYWDTDHYNVGFVCRGVNWRTEINFLGDFHISNVLVALGTMLAMKFRITELVPFIPQLTQIPGCLERVTAFNGAEVYIDNSKCGSSFETPLQSMRRVTKKRLIHLFGFKGDSSLDKRNTMYQTSLQFADYTIITDDDPDPEDAASVRSSVVYETQKTTVVPMRKVAIQQALAMLEPGDSLLISGRGRQEGVKAFGILLPYNDVRAILEAIEILSLSPHQTALDQE